MPRKIILSHAMGVPLWSVERLPVAGMKAERVEAYRAEDVEPLIAAVKDTLCDEEICSRCNFLREPLKAFEEDS